MAFPPAGYVGDPMSPEPRDDVKYGDGTGIPANPGDAVPMTLHSRIDVNVAGSTATPPSQPQPQPTTPTGVTGGTPGSFDPSTADVPADLTAANALGLMGSAFAPGEFVLLGDGSQAYFDGADFVAGVAPTPPAPPPDDGGNIYVPPDPSTLTLAAIQAWVNSTLGPSSEWGVNEIGAVQSMLNLERAGLNRPEVTDWLDQQPGVV